MTPITLADIPHTLRTVSISAFRNSALLLTLYLLALAIYRLYYHPLAAHPGPLLAKLTDWYSVYHAYIGDRHLALHRAHERYGPVVRLAPNTLSFNTSSALQSIYGHSRVARAVQKGRFYLAFPAVRGVHNTHNAISKVEHGRKRRVLSAAFSEAALKGMEGTVLANIDRMLSLFRDAPSESGVDVGEVFSWFTFDVMGELCFGRSFDMLQQPARRFVISLVAAAAHMHYIAGNYLPVKTLGLSRILFPTIASDRWRFISHSRECANERMRAPADAKRDFFYYLLHAKDPETGSGFTTAELWGEANVLMIAGSDTTATALSATLHYLCRTPSVLARLHSEIRGRFARADDIVTGPELARCTYLKACIDEAMRLAPPVPGLLPREVVADEGVTVDGVHVPCGTVIGTPIYALHHNARYFPAPFEFVPERWLGEEEEVECARAAYSPFSIGSRGCIGKGVAYMELRLAVARIVWEFDVEARSVHGKAERWEEGFGVFEGEFRMQDHFTSRKEGPVVVFKKR